MHGGRTRGGRGCGREPRTAAALWDLRRSQSSRLEITAPRNVERRGIQSHRASLQPDEVTVLDAIPLTTVHRTLLDLAAILPRAQLARALERAEALRLADPLPLDALLQRHNRRPGTKALREPRAAERAPTHTRSELEDRFLTFLDAYGLPRPEVNVLVDGFEVDFLWREAGLVAELDGFETHRTRAAFERDRARDRALLVDGLRVIRITWHALREGLAADLARLLQARFALRG
jgi:Protein of unknown function (DUF559)